MKITRRQLRKIILNETQRSIGLPQALDIDSVSVDTDIIEKARDIYRQFGKLDKEGDEYSKHNLPPGGEVLLSILINRIINIGRLMNPSSPHYDKIQADIARHRQSRLKQAHWLFGGNMRRYTSFGSKYSNDEKADQYELEWLERYQEILGGSLKWHTEKGWVAV